MTALAAILVRDMRIAVRVGGGALMGVLFFLVVAAMVPFALGPDLALLKRIGPAILWLAALLASLLALDRLFAADHEDGSLDLILTGRVPLELVVAVKRPIWLLDEPVSALDAAAQESLTEFMRLHLAGGGLILAATHGPIGLPAAHEVWLDQAAPQAAEEEP